MHQIKGVVYVSKGHTPPPYMQFPRFLAELDLSLTEKFAYMLIYNRVRLSAENSFVDEQNRAYVFYPIAKLAQDLRKKETAVKSALKRLEEAGLIQRKRQGVGKANRIYVLYPQAEIRPSNSRKSGCHIGGKPATNKNDNSKNHVVRDYCHDSEESL